MDTRFGIIGSPVKGSMSPVLFRAAYWGKYPYDLIEDDCFENAWERFINGYHGINVTAPYKEKAFSKAERLSPSAQLTGAVNLAVKTETGIAGYNTDYYGIILSVAEALGLENASEIALRGESAIIENAVRTVSEAYGHTPHALIIGAGGAARAATAAARSLGFTTAIANRTVKKAEALAKDLGDGDFQALPLSSIKTVLRESDLTVYTIPGPMEALDELGINEFSPTGLGPKLLLEANYKTPSFSGTLLEKLKKSGCRYIHGHRWLLFQAVSGYGIFTGEAPDAKAMEKALGNLNTFI